MGHRGGGPRCHRPAVHGVRAACDITSPHSEGCARFGLRFTLEMTAWDAGAVAAEPRSWLGGPGG